MTLDFYILTITLLQQYLSCYSSTDSAGNIDVPEKNDVFEVLNENDDKTHTREDMWSDESVHG